MGKRLCGFGGVDGQWGAGGDEPGDEGSWCEGYGVHGLGDAFISRNDQVTLVEGLEV
jgi:hypothetical protein